MDEDYRLVSISNKIFRAFYIKEFNELMNKYEVTFLHSVATDGILHCFKEKIDSLTDEEFKKWLNYHYSTCERLDLQGYSNHMIYICKKN